MFKGFYLPLIRAKIFGQRAPAPLHAGGGAPAEDPLTRGSFKTLRPLQIQDFTKFFVNF